MSFLRKWICILLLLGIGPIAAAQTIQVIKYPALQQILSGPSDSLLIVNFWATWCKPCVTELPYFNQLAKKYAGEKVKVVLINLDGVSKIDTRVRPFLAKRQTQALGMFLLDTAGDDNWIEKVSPEWSGALPFTIVIDPKKQQRKTYERPFTLAELNAEISPLIKN